MKRIIAAVLCLCAPVAWGVDLDYSFSYVGSYTPAGLTTPVDVFTLTESAPEQLLGAIVLDIGADYLGYGSNPFQVGIQESTRYHSTPTEEDANAWLATETFAYQSDSHFLFPPDWQPAIVSPMENNDASLGTYTDPYGQTEVRGLGGLRVATAVPVAERTAVMDIVRVGVLRDSAVYLKGEICDGLGRVRELEAIQLPMLYQDTWQGSGTGGRTSTDPNDPTVQWTRTGNWSRGVVPGPSDDVRIELTNPGRVNAALGTAGSVWVDSSAPGGTFDIPAGADLGITGSLIVGTQGTGAAIQSGRSRCTIFTLGEEPGSYGAYTLDDGQLTVDGIAYIGKHGKGVFTQTGGTFQARGTLQLGQPHAQGSQGTCQFQGGYMSAGTVALGAYGSSPQPLFHQTGGSLDTQCIILRRTSVFHLGDGEVRAVVELVRGTFVQTGGKNIVTERLTIGSDVFESGPYRYELRGGELDANEIVGPVSMLGGAFSVQAMDGVLTNDGGVISPGHSIGTMQLGGLVQTAGTLLIELGGLGDCDQVLVTHSAGLGGIVDVQSLSGYRPRDGDTFTILAAADPNGLQGAGNFATFASNITTGLPGGVAFSGAVEGANYKLTFLGCTTGDANGDHAVNGGDLGLMGGNWMKGQSRPFSGDANRDDIVNGGDLALMGGGWMMAGKGWSDGDFNGDGKVDGGDLALMVGDWMWTRPAAPPVGQALPEPATALLLAAGGIVLWRRRQGG